MNTAQSLKDIGLKATLPRRKILELFETSKDVRHLSAEDVYRKLIAEGIDVGLATVYRVLTQFEQAGLLSRQHFETGKAVFELNQGGHHDHLVSRSFTTPRSKSGRWRSPASAASACAATRLRYTRTAASPIASTARRRGGSRATRARAPSRPASRRRVGAWSP